MMLCANISVREKRLRALLYAPAVCLCAALTINHFTGWIFYIAPYNGVNAYFHGRFFIAMYINSVFCLVATLVILIKYRARLVPKQYHTMLSFILITIGSIILQFFFPDVLLTGVALTLSIFLMYFTLQNPDDMFDIISGVFNYNAMMVYLDAAISRGETLRLVIVDVGGIRRVNSIYGLLMGNKVFASVGRYLKGLDSANWVFRIVGSRFMIAAPDDRRYEKASEAAQERFKNGWMISESELRLPATIRYFQTQNVYESAEELLALVDEIYANVGTGNWGNCKPIESDVLEAMHRRTVIERAIRSALHTKKGLSLHYQPIWHARSGLFISAEALLRLESDGLGTISPAEFIPIAEKNGLILQVDEYVIKAACDFLKQRPELKFLEINLSAAEFFENPSARIHRLVEKCGVEPGRVCFEVTETAADQHPEMLTAFMGDMLEHGYRFALDDFGTGYSNITKVVRLPFSIIKIDKILLEDDEKTRILLQSIAQMFEGIGVTTVVEGVESGAQSKRLPQQIDYIQGFFYARPMPEKDFDSFMSKQPELHPSSVYEA